MDGFVAVGDVVDVETIDGFPDRIDHTHGQQIFAVVTQRVGHVEGERCLTAFASLLFVLSFFYFCTSIYISNATAFQIPFLACPAM